MLNAIALKSCVIILFAVWVAAFFCRKFFYFRDAYRWALVWSLPVLVAGITTSAVLLYGTILFCSVKLVPKDRQSRVFYFVLLLSAMPQMGYRLPFPGINYIFELTHHRALILFLLLPIYLELRRERSPEGRMQYIDYLVAFFCIATTLLDFRYEFSITNWARAAFLKFVDLWIPYYVLSREIKNFKLFWTALVFSGLALALNALIDWRLTWKSYAQLGSQVSGANVSWMFVQNQYRGLGLRISSSWLEPISFGFFMTITALVLLKSECWGRKRGVLVYGAACAAVLALVLTDSRGAQIMLVVGAALLMYFSIRKKVLRGVLVLSAVVAVFLLSGSVGSVVENEGGTFQYRWNLVVYSQDAISRNPMFGTPFFRSNPVLVEYMTQGQGLVDIVNTYLRILLQYGFVGLLAFVLIVFYPIKAIASRITSGDDSRESLVPHGVLLLGVLGGSAFLIYTTSTVGYTPTYLWLLIAAGVSYVRLWDGYKARQPD